MNPNFKMLFGTSVSFKSQMLFLCVNNRPEMELLLHGLLFRKLDHVAQYFLTFCFLVVTLLICRWSCWSFRFGLCIDDAVSSCVLRGFLVRIGLSCLSLLRLFCVALVYFYILCHLWPLDVLMEWWSGTQFTRKNTKV